MSKSLILLFLFAVSIFSHAATGKEFLKKVRANYEDLNSLELLMSYRLYKGHESNEVRESYGALFCRDGEQSYRKIDQTEFINTKDYSIKISHSEKMIVVSQASKMDAFDVDIETSLKWCENVLVADKGEFNEISLIIKDRTDLPFSKINVVVDKKFWIREMTLFYSTQMNFSSSYTNKEMDFPKIFIGYYDLKKKWNDKDGLLNMDNYILVEEKKILPATRLSGYTILNLTNS